MSRQYDERYSVLTELNAEARAFRNITVRNIVILIVFLFLDTLLIDKVFVAIQPLFFIFHMTVGLLMCMNSRMNKQKRLYQSLLIMFCKGKDYYAPIEDPEKLPTTEYKYKNMYSKGVVFLEPEDEEY